MKKIYVIIMIIAAMIMITGCSSQDTAPAVDSDSNSNYKAGSKVKVDDNIYTISGTVAADVTSLTRESEPAHGSITGPSCFGTSGCYGGTSGSFFGPVQSGKGYVRLQVDKVSPETDLAIPGDISILKVSDTKATALLPGDKVTFKCRRQYEAVAAVKDNETFDADKVETWELDYCRLATAVVGVP